MPTYARDYFDLSFIFGPDGNCLLCKLEDGCHANGCPGKLFDHGRLKFVATYTTGGCNRGCCSSSDHRDESDTREDPIAQIARHDPPRSVQVVIGVDLDAIEGPQGDSCDSILAAATAPRKAAAEKAEAARRKSARDNLLRILEEQRGDLSPEGYERRRAKILTDYPE